METIMARAASRMLASAKKTIESGGDTALAIRNCIQGLTALYGQDCHRELLQGEYAPGHTDYLQGISVPILVDAKGGPSETDRMRIGERDGKPVLLITPVDGFFNSFR